MVLKKYRKNAYFFVVFLGLVAILFNFQNCTKTNFAATSTSSETPATGEITTTEIPVSSGSNCSAQTFNWTVAGQSCSASASAINHGQSGLSVNDSDGPIRGLAQVKCENGVLSLMPNPVATCSATASNPIPLDCAAQLFTWTIGSKSCSVSVSALINGVSGISIADNDGTTRGTAQIKCLNSTVSVLANPAATCADAEAPPPPPPMAERPKFLKDLYKKGVDSFAMIATGYSPTVASQLQYCLQAIGSSTCNSSANFIGFQTSSQYVSLTVLSLEDYLKTGLAGANFINGEMFLKVDLSMVPPGTYQVQIQEITYIRYWGWGSSMDIQTVPAFITLQ